MNKLDATHILTPALVLHDRFVPMELAQDEYYNRFGGPLELRFENWPADAPRPQQVIRIDSNGPATRGLCLAGFLPLPFPFRMSGARMKYAITGSNRARIIALEGDRSSQDWPYADYPAMFPTAPLKFGAPQAIEWDAVDGDDEGYPMTWQDTRPTPGEALVIVPPNDRYGVSLWGEGDLEQVQLLFRINLRERTVEAWTECG